MHKLSSLHGNLAKLTEENSSSVKKLLLNSNVTHGWADEQMIMWSIITIIIWLLPRASKMKRILCSDWLPERVRWTYCILPARDFPLCSRKSEILWCNLLAIYWINPFLTKLVRSRWLDIGLFFFFAFLWTETSSRSIKTQKKEPGQYPATLTKLGQ